MAHAQPAPTKWFLAEGAANNFFTEDILIGNPNAAAVSVQITLLPQSDSGQPGAPVVIPTFQINATSRYTFHVNGVPNLPSGSVSALVVCASCTGNQGIVVERTMTWFDARKRGGHNSQGVLETSPDWFLAEGVTGFFETFILIANPDPTQTANVQVTYLREFSGPLVQTFTMGPNTRKTIYVNQGVDTNGGHVFITEPFSTAVHSQNGVGLVVERSMYWNAYEGGHEGTGVPAASNTWLFAEGVTGGSPAFIWDTYFLLANAGSNDAHIQMTFFRDAGTPVNCTAVVGAHHRKTIHANELANPVQQLTCDAPALLASAAFATKITSDQPIVAERAVYWTTSGITWIDGNDTPGVTAEAPKWAFAEGVEGRIDQSGIVYNSYFLFSNSGAAPLPLKATFMREDGTGIVAHYTINPQSRFTLPTSSVLEMSNEKFSAFFESENNATFVAERAVYWGDGYYGGHGSTGTPWTAAIAAPAMAPSLVPVVTSVTPGQGPIGGGTDVTIQGASFTQSTSVKFGGRNATAMYVTNASTLLARTPAGAQSGAVSVSVSNPNGTSVPGGTTTVANAFTYTQSVPTLTVQNIIAFGDSITHGDSSMLCGPLVCGIDTPGYPPVLASNLSSRYPLQTITVANDGNPGECASIFGCSISNSIGRERLPMVMTSATDLVILLEGVNDLNTGQSISATVNALHAMVDTVRSQGKQAVLCTLLPVKSPDSMPDADISLWKADPTRVQALNAEIVNLAAFDQVPLVNMFAAFGVSLSSTVDCSSSSSCRALLSADGLHPTPAGYQRMAQALYNTIVATYEVVR